MIASLINCFVIVSYIFFFNRTMKNMKDLWDVQMEKLVDGGGNAELFNGTFMREDDQTERIQNPLSRTSTNFVHHHKLDHTKHAPLQNPPNPGGIWGQ